MIKDMFSKLKKVSLVVLAVTAAVFSRLLFVLFNDPEGPNMLIVGVTTAIVYVVSLPAYLLRSSSSSSSRIGLTIFFQAVVVAMLYFLLG